MYPLVQIGPLRLSSGGLLLLVSIIVGGLFIVRVAQARGGAQLARQVDQCFYPVLIGAGIGARLWYGLFNLDLYSRNPGMFIVLRVSDFAWPGALLGGLLAGYVWCRRNGFDELKLVDSAALTLPAVQMIASVGLLLSGEAFGVPTSLPWAVPLFGAMRHPTQIYFALAALSSLIALWWLSRRLLPVGALFTFCLGLQGLTSLLVEALRADSLVLPGGIRAAQVFGLALLLYTLTWAQRHSGLTGLMSAETSEPALQEQS
ncbi:MAG: prolipoprotein diacylglyceryl transferase [Roseiflexaceae bacterium]